MEDITLNIQEGPRLRSENLPENSHILETTTDSDEIYEDNSILEDDDKYLEQLNYLHESNLLGDSNISYEKIPTLYRSAIEKGMDHDLEKEMEKPDLPNLPVAEISQRNILPEGTKRHVRFRFPEISRK